MSMDQSMSRNKVPVPSQIQAKSMARTQEKKKGSGARRLLLSHAALLH